MVSSLLQCPGTNFRKDFRQAWVCNRLDLGDGQFSERCDTDYFWEKLNIAIIAIIFLDHRERLFFDYFSHFRTNYFGIIHDLPPTRNHEKPWKINREPWKTLKIHEKLWKTIKTIKKNMKNHEKPIWNHENHQKPSKTNLEPWKTMKTDLEPWKTNLEP